ncbi:rab-like protein 6 [Lingula anatina]|uniref:Rab-like protein 6 n=1 Tax=Lingula anatina TaxID=7574 RepID=A0A1S3IBN9_LINAN|nr:rab-like protein 6 [Lingula anatina]|eukprot:XP_013395672.1 rab-like protein 6 [Lingula anatina]
MSFFKKLFSGDDKEKAAQSQVASATPPPGMQTMGVSLQRKFAKGVQYNMKIIIKGDRNVGKTCLFYRLQGQKFKEEYIPTDEIQVASIQWNYKNTDDVVKVEVWDVVDKGKKKKKSDGLKLDNVVEEEEPSEPCLDAQFVDVYKGTHGVILMLDITKQWTFDYIERELPKVPHTIPVLIMSNHRDMGHHRTVLDEKIKYLIEEVQENRPDNSAPIRCMESSMRNGFGLKYVHKFFNLPFLQLQKETLLKQLEINVQEFSAVLEELDIQEESEEQNYDMFIEGVSEKRRAQQEKLAVKAIEEAKKKEEAEKAAQAALQEQAEHAKGNVMPKSISHPNLPVSQQEKQTMSVSPSANQLSASPQPPAPSLQAQEQKSGGFMSRFFGNKDKQEKQEKQTGLVIQPSGQPQVGSVEDFVPEEGLDAEFLEDTKDSKDLKTQKREDNSDSDDSGGNPMVAGFQDELDSEDEEPPKPAADFRVAPHDEEPSSEDEETTGKQAQVLETKPRKVELSSDDDDNSNQPGIMLDEDLDSPDEAPSSSVLIPQPVAQKDEKTEMKQSSLEDKKSVTKEQKRSTTSSESDSKSISQKNKVKSKKKKSAKDVELTDSDEELPVQTHVDQPSVLQEDVDTVSIDSEEERLAANHVAILGDLDVSEGDEDLHPVKKPVVVIDTEDKKEVPPVEQRSSLFFEDLSILEKGLSAGSVSSSRPETENETPDTTIKTKKKKKKKDKQEEGKPKKTKSKKSKAKDEGQTLEEETKEKKKKKKKKIESEPNEIGETMDDLEAFLGGGGGYESL